MFYRPVYEHNQNTLSADSGYIYEDENQQQFFEAYGNVIITQPSGTVIYSDELHYDAAKEFAILTNNVKMVDDNSVLTTHYLTYDMRRKQGTYTTGGRIINQVDTITSQNAYYFENTQDAYFRNKVVVRTPDVQIYTDTMRYNSDLRETYFYGPTDLKGNDGGNLYTEKGRYNTETGIAHFSLNNLYTEETRFLKSDSLYYDRQSGIGEAYRNVVFVDTADSFFAYGEYGKYNQKDESITMTDKPLVVSVVKDSVQENNVHVSDTLQMSDTIPQDSNEIQEKPISDEEEKALADSVSQNKVQTDSLAPPKMQERIDSIYLTADTLYSKMIYLKDYKALNLNLDRGGGDLDIDEEEDYGDDDFFDDDEGEIKAEFEVEKEEPEDTEPEEENKSEEKKDGGEEELREENIELKIQKDERDIQDTSRHKVIEKITKIELPSDTIKTDSTTIEKSVVEDEALRERVEMPSTAKTDSLMSSVLLSLQTPDSSADVSQSPSDTLKTRILKAYHNVRLYKSDLQAVADSAYYGEADSMFRFFGEPMIWAEGSQISADTIYMQVKNEQLDNALLLQNAFMVNAVLDTVKFNQLKGRKMTAFFANNQMDLLYVDGNAENLIFSADDKAGIITEMFHDRSGRIKIEMQGNEILRYTSIRKIDQKVYPIKMVNQDNEILPGFIWKPQDRPKSKDDLLNRSRKKEISEEVPNTSSETQQEGKEKSDDDEDTRGLEDIEIEALDDTSKENMHNEGASEETEEDIENKENYNTERDRLK